MNSKAQKLAYQAYSASLVEHCTHALTLQTNLRTYNKSARNIMYKSDGAIQAYRQLIPRLNRILTGNGWTRNANYIPLIIPALEGTKTNDSKVKTLHFHLALGNFDLNRIDFDAIEKIKKFWESTQVGTKDIELRKLVDGSESRWGEYISKEVWINNLDCVDYANLQKPAYLTDI